MEESKGDNLLDQFRVVIFMVIPLTTAFDKHTDVFLPIIAPDLTITLQMEAHLLQPTFFFSLAEMHLVKRNQ